jgi:hypothetical protein
MRGVVVVSIVRSMSCLYCSRDLLGTERDYRLESGASAR